MLTCCTATRNNQLSVSKKDAENILSYARELQGVKYRYGGKTPETGFDCSGFISYIYKKAAGITLSPASAMQAKTGRAVSLKKVRPGDLMFFKGRNTRSKKVGHVALVTAIKSGKISIIHASTGKGVHEEIYNASTYWKARFLFARRVAIVEKK
ncbi:MAG: C40 family peptidase [Bacteroidales bacterium]|nr:C40 family peptidase [Bacteroidales bacterium]